jgi:hypothetical protein
LEIVSIFVVLISPLRKPVGTNVAIGEPRRSYSGKEQKAHDCAARSTNNPPLFV